MSFTTVGKKLIFCVAQDRKKILFWFCFLVVYVSYVNFLLLVASGWNFRRVEIRHADGQNRTVVTETQGRHPRVVTMELAKTLLVETVPYVYITV